jgi:hypothetical protein
VSLGFRRVLLAEFIDAAAGIHNFLLARVERMAIGANFDLQILANGRASLEMVAAGASDRDDFVIWMNAGFHGNLDMSVAAESMSIQCASPRLKSSVVGQCRKERLPKTGPITIYDRDSIPQGF